MLLLLLTFPLAKNERGGVGRSGVDDVVVPVAPFSFPPPPPDGGSNGGLPGNDGRLMDRIVPLVDVGLRKAKYPAVASKIKTSAVVPRPTSKPVFMVVDFSKQ